MADKDDIAVEIDEDEGVSVSIDDTGQPVEAAPPTVKKEPRQRTRVTKDVVIQDTATAGPSPEDALQQALAVAQQQETARKAAEATAASERARAEASERARQQALREAHELAERADSSEMTLIESNIAAAERELEAQRDAFTRAAEAGEFAKMADIQIKMSKAAAALDRLGDAKVALENNPRRHTPAAAPEPHAVNAQEKYLSQFNPTAQSWLRQHMECLPPEHGGSEEKFNNMMAGHHVAIAKRVALNTPEYFRIIEDHLNPTAAAAPAPVNPAHAPAAQPHLSRAAAPTPAAPPSRDAPSASGQPQPRSVREVRLSKAQQEMAEMSFPHLAKQQAWGQYAKNLLELEQEGKLGRSHI